MIESRLTSLDPGATLPHGLAYMGGVPFWPATSFSQTGTSDVMLQFLDAPGSPDVKLQGREELADRYHATPDIPPETWWEIQGIIP